MKPFPVLLALGAVIVLLVGCGGGESTETTQAEWVFQDAHINLEGMAGAEDAGLAMAEHLDYLTKAGIGASINSPILPERPTKYVDEELVDAALVHEPQLVLAVAEEDRPLVAVGSVVSEPTMAMIWLPGSGIGGIADLKGKTIAYPGVPYQKLFLEFVLRQAGLTPGAVKIADAGNDLIPALVKGRADAIFGGSWNAEGPLLESRGLKPVIARAADLGIPAYEELVLVARRDHYEKKPALFERILRATIRGNEAAGDDPETAAKAVVALSFGAVPQKGTEAGVEATGPLFSGTGEIDQAQLQNLIDWMHEQGMTEGKMPASAVLAEPSGETG